MAFSAPHVSFVSFAVEILPAGITQVMIVETGLHLNPKHPSYDRAAVEALITAARLRRPPRGGTCVGPARLDP